MARVGDHAVVLGASIAGMLAARVLGDFYRTVTVVDRDDLSANASGLRRGVPQGRHAHLLAARGSQIVGELFPGLLDELVDGGAPVWDDGDMSRIDVTFGGHRMVRSGTLPGAGVDTAYAAHYASRPFLESSIRRRLAALPNVTLVDRHDVLELTTDAARTCVTGARIVSNVDGEPSTLSADLVVDATGRGSRTPAFLEGLGFGRPAEDEVVVRLAYASQWLRMPSGTMPSDLVIVSPTRDRSTLMALARYENDICILTLGGMLGVEPPLEPAAMLDFAADLAPAYVGAALRAAEPVGEPSRYRVPSNRWRRYDKMARLPQGLLVFGDAICSFNPIYGQGMTVAAMEAVMLRDALRRGGRDLPRRFAGAAAGVVAVAWQMAAGSDLALPGVPGRRSPAMRLTNRYTDRVLAAAEHDIVVAESFLRVSGFIDPPVALMRPSLMVRVLRANRRATEYRIADADQPYPSPDTHGHGDVRLVAEER